MKIELPPLPYGDVDLAPHISANTISFHYGKHHKTYVEKAKDMVKGTEFADAELEDIVKATRGQADKKGLFNNAAQAWNHSFYWKSLTPKGGAPSGKLLDKINTDFGDLAKLKDALANAAVTQFVDASKEVFGEDPLSAQLYFMFGSVGERAGRREDSGRRVR